MPDVVDAGLEARILVEDVTGLRGAALALEQARVLAPREAELLAWALARRADGMPLAYVLGHWEFFGLDLAVGPAALIPRPETEVLVDQALARMAAPERVRVCDLGTGTGAIALALKAQRPDWRVTAIDASEAALSLAARNARTLGLDLTLIAHDFGRALPGGPYDLLVANPPYIPSCEVDALPRAVRVFEPRVALDGGRDGLQAHATILARAGESLAPGGLLIVELAAGQAGAYERLVAQSGMRLAELVRDLAGHERVAVVGRAGAGEQRRDRGRGGRTCASERGRAACGGRGAVRKQEASPCGQP